MKHALGIGFFLIFAATVWSASPLIAMGFNVLVRSDYHLREFGNEYRARLMPNRVRWYDYRTYHMDCAAIGRQRIVILHTTKFSEPPLDFLARTFPHCANIEREKDQFPSLFHGIFTGRW